MPRRVDLLIIAVAAAVGIVSLVFVGPLLGAEASSKSEISCALRVPAHKLFDCAYLDPGSFGDSCRYTTAQECADKFNAEYYPNGAERLGLTADEERDRESWFLHCHFMAMGSGTPNCHCLGFDPWRPGEGACS